MSSICDTTRPNRLLATMLCLMIVSACGHEPVRRVGDAGSNPVSVQSGRQTITYKSTGEKAAAAALQQLGVPYRFGGATTNGFDCSGLAQYAYGKAGTRIPRTTTQQWRELSPVTARKLAVGDILFFRIDGDISHVGVYVGKNRFVHAPSSGRTVSVASLDSDFYGRAFVRGGRP